MIRIFGMTDVGVAVVEHALRRVVTVMTVGAAAAEIVLELELSGAYEKLMGWLVLVDVTTADALLDVELLSGPSTPPTTPATSPALGALAAAAR